MGAVDRVAVTDEVVVELNGAVLELGPKGPVAVYVQVQQVDDGGWLHVDRDRAGVELGAPSRRFASQAAALRSAHKHAAALDAVCEVEVVDPSTMTGPRPTV